MFHFIRNFLILKYNSFPFQWVIFSFLFIVMDFTSILFFLNSNYRLGFILVFKICDLKFHIIYAVSFIYIIWVLVVFHSHHFKASLFPSKENGLVSPLNVNDCILCCIYWFPHYPWLWPLIWIAASIGNYFPSLCIFTIYHQGDPLPPIIFNLVV